VKQLKTNLVDESLPELPVAGRCDAEQRETKERSGCARPVEKGVERRENRNQPDSFTPSYPHGCDARPANVPLLAGRPGIGRDESRARLRRGNAAVALPRSVMKARHLTGSPSRDRSTVPHRLNSRSIVPHSNLNWQGPRQVVRGRRTMSSLRPTPKGHLSTGAMSRCGLKRLDDRARRLERHPKGRHWIPHRNRARSVADAGWPIRIWKGKRSNATEGGGRGRQPASRSNVLSTADSDRFGAVKN